MFSLLLLSVTTLAHAGDNKPAEDKPKPEVEVSGVMFAHYGVDLTEGKKNFNDFGVDTVPGAQRDATHFRDITPCWRRVHRVHCECLGQPSSTPPPEPRGYPNVLSS